MAENAFNEKEDYLIAVKEEVDKRDAMAAELEKLRLYQKRLGRNIMAEEISISEEIATTVKKRKQEITASYDERLDDNRARRKKVTNKRDKKKSQRMSQRIDEETKHIRKDSKALEVEMKTLFKKNKVPSFCTSKLYYSMFMPRGLGEAGTMLLMFILFFIAIPGGVTVLFNKTALHGRNVNEAFWYVLIAAIMFVVQLLIYFVIYNMTKNRHGDVISQGRSIRDKIKANKRQADAIKNSISKDKDESKYNLDAYDERLASLDKEADAIGAEKQDALNEFEDTTKQLIIDEINGRRLQTLEDMKAEKKSIEDKITIGEKKYNDKVLFVTSKYAPILGEDLCKSEKLADLISLIEEGEAENVSDAINLYKGQKASK